MTFRDFALKIKTGTITAQSEMVSIDKIVDWPRQTDQKFLYDWLNPNLDKSSLFDYSEVVVGLSGQKTLGYLNASLVFDFWTDDMLSYFNTNYVSSNNAALSISYFYLGSTKYYTCKAELIRPEHIKVLVGGQEVKLKLNYGVEITS